MKKKIIMLLCAGCTSGFDTRKFFHQTRELLGNSCDLTSKLFLKGDEEYDLLVVVNGCSRYCIENQDYKGDVMMIDDTNYKEAISHYLPEYIHPAENRS